MKPYYSDQELVTIASNCNNYDEILRASVLIGQLSRQGVFVGVYLFEKLAHLQIRKLASL